MADKKITELTEVTSLPDEALITAVDSTRSAGDQNISIKKSNLQLIRGSQDFTATADQTDFEVTANPDNLILVFSGSNLARSVDFTYTSGVTVGTLSFNEGRIVGTEIKVIY